MQADAPRAARPRLVSVPSAPPASSPALVIDDEHKRTTLEQRLDAVVLAAGATPPHGIRAPSSKRLVPLRLDRPAPRVQLVDERTGPAPRMLQFLLDDHRPGSVTDDSVSAIPRLEPVQDSGRLPVTIGIQTNVYRLGSVVEEETPSRPLPVLGLADDEVETRKLKRVEKVLTLKTLDQLDVRLSAFTSSDTDSDTDSDIIEIVNEMRSDMERANHAAAAVALPVFSEEGPDQTPSFDAADLGGDLDELARQLGLEGLVPRTTPPTRADDSLDGDDLLRADPLADLAELDARIAALDGDIDDLPDELDADDVEIVAVTTPTNPMRAMVMSRPIIPVDAVDALEDDDDDDDGFALVPTPPSGTQRLPSSLLEGIDVAAANIDAAGFDDDDVATPAHGTIRPRLEAPSAVRFIIAEAPARPRKAALSKTELERNRARAHDLYLIALDDIACRDPQSAIVHLELALAYDDETPLYHDLLAQVQRKVLRQQPETKH